MFSLYTTLNNVLVYILYMDIVMLIIDYIMHYVPWFLISTLSIDPNNVAQSKSFYRRHCKITHFK